MKKYIRKTKEKVYDWIDENLEEALDFYKQLRAKGIHQATAIKCARHFHAIILLSDIEKNPDKYTEKRKHGNKKRNTGISSKTIH